jgi:predicted double-glycine peptidase
MTHADSSKTNKRRTMKVAIPTTMALSLCGISVWFFLLRSPAPELNHLPLTRQSTDYTCGPASLQSILAYYGEEWSEDTLAREVKSDPEEGTNYREIVRFARSKGLTADAREGMTIDDLARAIKEHRPVIVAIQAWGDHQEKYADDWEDGHYAIVVGVDDDNVYLMDPSTLGNYTFIPIPQFLARWHDAEKGPDRRMNKLVQFGIIFGKDKGPSYNPELVKPME